MAVPASFELKVEYDEHHDVHVVYPCCHIENEADCKAWYAAYERAFGRHNRVDCVIVLSMFSVAPEAKEIWSGYRQRVYEEIVRFSVRVETDMSVLLSRHQKNIPRDVAADIPSALALLQTIRAERRSAG